MAKPSGNAVMVNGGCMRTAMRHSRCRAIRRRGRGSTARAAAGTHHAISRLAASRGPNSPPCGDRVAQAAAQARALMRAHFRLSQGELRQWVLLEMPGLLACIVHSESAAVATIRKPSFTGSLVPKLHRSLGSYRLCIQRAYPETSRCAPGAPDSRPSLQLYE